MKKFVCARCNEEINVRVLEKEKQNYIIKDGYLFCSTYCVRVFSPNEINSNKDLARKPIKKYNKNK